MNIYFICVIVHVQMWCVCAQPYVDQTKKIFYSFFFLLLEVICITHVFQVVFVWKTCFLGVYVTHFMCKINWELNGPNLKFFNFGQKISRLFRDYLMSKAYSRKISLVTSQVSFQRKFPDQLFKRHFVGHLF